MGKTIIAYGLPGSGKTYYGEQLAQKGNLTVISMDDHMEDGKYRPITEVVKEVLELRHYILNDIYIDALITTRDNLIKIVRELHKFFVNEEPKYRNYGKNFEIVYWDENRAACKENIRKRNDGRNVEVTIDNLPFEKLRESAVYNLIREIDIEIKTTFKERKVYMDGSNWEKYFQPLIDKDYYTNGKYFYSDEWSLGGSWGDCWGNSGSISADEQPNSFKEFDNLLEKVCPNITFIQYKTIYNECVSIDKRSIGDYYGGTEYRACFKLDVKKCYEMLLEKELIEM